MQSNPRGMPCATATRASTGNPSRCWHRPTPRVPSRCALTACRTGRRGGSFRSGRRWRSARRTWRALPTTWPSGVMRRRRAVCSARFMRRTRRRDSMLRQACAASTMSGCPCRTLTRTASARWMWRARTRRARNRRGWTRAGAWVKRSAHCFKCCGIGWMMQRAAVPGTRVTSWRMPSFCGLPTPQTMPRASMMRRAATFCASSATCFRTGCTRSCETAAAVLRSVVATTHATPRAARFACRRESAASRLSRSSTAAARPTTAWRLALPPRAAQRRPRPRARVRGSARGTWRRSTGSAGTGTASRTSAWCSRWATAITHDRRARCAAPAALTTTSATATTPSGTGSRKTRRGGGGARQTSITARRRACTILPSLIWSRTRATMTLCTPGTGAFATRPWRALPVRRTRRATGCASRPRTTTLRWCATARTPGRTLAQRIVGGTSCVSWAWSKRSFSRMIRWVANSGSGGARISACVKTGASRSAACWRCGIFWAASLAISRSFMQWTILRNAGPWVAYCRMLPKPAS